MKILCYGDSNTWGYIPNVNGYSKNATTQQYSEKDCWWHGLKKGNELFVDGLCGRSIVHEHKYFENRNATKTIMQDLSKYPNPNLIVVQLGTNDCKSEYADSPQQITNNLQELSKIICKQTSAKLVVISPAIIRENTPITKKYYVGAQEKSQKLDALYKNMAQKNGYIFLSGADLDIGEDGEHLTKLGHKQLKNKLQALLANECKKGHI